MKRLCGWNFDVGCVPSRGASPSRIAGTENAVFERDGEVRIGVTYMTGSLVRVGNGIAGAILGRGGNGWAGYLLLWLGFVAGVALGALSFGSGNSETLWAASGAALALAGVSVLVASDRVRIAPNPDQG